MIIIGYTTDFQHFLNKIKNTNRRIKRLTLRLSGD